MVSSAELYTPLDINSSSEITTEETINQRIKRYLADAGVLLPATIGCISAIDYINQTILDLAPHLQEYGGNCGVSYTWLIAIFVSTIPLAGATYGTTLLDGYLKKENIESNKNKTKGK